jgi:hypothetical protein
MQAALDRDAELGSRLAGDHINKTTELLTYAVELYEAGSITDGETAAAADSA